MVYVYLPLIDEKNNVPKAREFEQRDDGEVGVGRGRRLISIPKTQLF